MTHSIGSKILSQRLTCSPHLHSVIMMNKRLLFAFLLVLFCSVNTYALTVEGLYEAEVPIPDQSIQYRKGGIAAALRSVMVKLTGDRNVFGRSAAVDMIKEAERYVQQYEYRSKQVRSRDQLTSEKQLHLWVNFNAKALNDSLRNYAIPVWGQERPSTLVWLASQKDQRRKLITQEDESGYTEILNQRTAQRGIPIVYPLLDLEDTLVLKASISLTHIATKSMPMVSCLFMAMASFILVPTPSVPETKTGSLYSRLAKSNKAPNPPSPPITPAVWVLLAADFIRSTSWLPFSMSTPAFW